jgi:hypothetical protein
MSNETFGNAFVGGEEGKSGTYLPMWLPTYLFVMGVFFVPSINFSSAQLRTTSDDHLNSTRV